MRGWSAGVLAGLTLASCALAAGANGEAVSLWPNGAPGSEGMTTPEVVTPRSREHAFISITNVNNPSILVYLPPKDKATGTGVVVYPGGGHRLLAMDVEGYEIADWLNKQGIAAFVLKYRLAQTPGAHYTVEGTSFSDAQRAIRLVRSRAKEWGVGNGRLGVMGFSAGGALAAMAETRFDAGNAEAADPVDRFGSRPDFSVLVYPGFKVDAMAVPKDAPPAFLVCADNDRSHVVTTVKFYLALEAAEISSELHVYSSGGHGFGMRDKNAPVSTWNARLEDWMFARGVLSKAP